MRQNQGAEYWKRPESGRTRGSVIVNAPAEEPYENSPRADFHSPNTRLAEALYRMIKFQPAPAVSLPHVKWTDCELIVI